ncbi:MAG: hypothetical protein SF069_00840 [Phycisphaerae bacterium]|nr:hypothetical protein [Phycisphaerae bacterium]
MIVPSTRRRVQRAIPHLLWGLAITLFLAVPGPWIETWSGFDWRRGTEWIVIRFAASNLEISRSAAMLSELWLWTDAPGGFGFGGPDRSAIRIQSDSMIPRWVDNASQPEADRDVPAYNSTVASGAPLRCAVYSRRIGEDAQGQPVAPFVDAAELGELTLFGISAICVIPLRVLWLGFLVNVAFWGLVSAAVAYAISALRRRLRIAKNLCPQCGYDIRGAASDRCSECGGAIRPAAA